MHLTAWLTSLMLATAALAFPVHAQSAEPDRVARAEDYAEDAFAAYSRGEFAAALALYIQAYDAAPSADISYNIARIYDTKLKDRVRAVEYYARYADDPGASPERLAAVNERLGVLRAQLAAASPTPPANAARTRVLPEGGSQPTAARSRDGGLSELRLAGLLVGAVGVVALGTGVGFGLAAKSDADVAHALCDGNACESRRGVDAAERGTRFARISTIAFVAAGALLMGGAGLLIFGGRGVEREARATLAPWASASAAGLHLASTF